jgi:hypothetical protein
MPLVGVSSLLILSTFLTLTDMRIALVFATLFFGLSIGSQAIATVSEVQEKRADQFCQVDPNYCNAK